MSSSRCLTVLALLTAVAVTVADDAPQRPSVKSETSPESRGGAKPEAKSDEAIDFDRAQELFRRRNSGGTLTAAEEAYLQKALAARRAGGGQANDRRPEGGRESTGFKPLTEMTAVDRYKDQDGGLYGEGRNTPPDAHRKAAEIELAKIQPLDAAGKPAPNGRIAFVSISMSNATQEFSLFKRIADADPDKSPRVTIVDCAQGGQAMAEWVSPDARPWLEADRRIAAAGVSADQVQAVWVKLANKGPRGTLPEHGRKLQRDTLAVLQNARARFPNLRIAYLSSRIYGGYAGGNLNPEPYAYESAFVVRWLIRDQIEGAKGLNFLAAKGEVEAPLLLWGPYLWADGTTPRKSDELVYRREDLAGDGTHPSESGRRKVAEQMLKFYKTDPLASTWFLARKPAATSRR